MLNSELVRRLNVVKIYYMDGKQHRSLFESSDAPLYLVGDIPNIDFNIETKSAWDTTKTFTDSPLKQAVIQGVASKIGGGNHFSGCLDLRSKFAFFGSKPLEFSSIKCMLINTEGWDKSIAPTLNKIVDWVLPSVKQNERTGKDYVLLDTFSKELHNQEGTLTNDPKSDWGKTYNSLYSLLVKGLDAVKDWIGDIKFLNMPKEYEVLDIKNVSAYLVIGPAGKDKKARFEIPDIYIDKVSISIPRSFMLNAKGEPEPDKVEITFSIKTLRQTTQSMFKF